MESKFGVGVNMRFKRILTGILVFFFMGIYCYFEKTKLNPHYGRIFYKLAWECEHKCSVQKQRGYYQKALYHDPALGDVYYRIGFLLEKEGKSAEALPWYKKAASLDFTHHEAHYKVGLQYYREHDYDMALRHLLMSDQAEPSYGLWHNQNEPHPSIWNNNYYLARIYEKRELYQLALMHYKLSIARCGTISFRPWVGLGVIYHLMGDDRNEASQASTLWSVREGAEAARQLDRYIKTGYYPDILRD